MRIPPSVFVMSVVTAVPFGLGIRDTLKHKDVSAEEYGDDLDLGGSRDRAARERALAEYEAESRQAAAEREAAKAKKLQSLDQLFGAQPAQLGSLFDGITIGANAGAFQPEHVRQRIENVMRDGFVSVQFDVDAKTLNGIDVTLLTDYETTDACETLGEKLVAKWGSTTHHTWLDPATHLRASYDEDHCKLRFERYVDPAQWVAQLPISAIGMSVDKLGQQLVAGDFEVDGNHVFWSAPGVGYGMGATKVEAFVKNGKIVGFQASANSDFDSTLAIRDAISAKLKAEPKQERDASDDEWSAGTYVWKKRVPVMLETANADRVLILVGAAPWD